MGGDRGQKFTGPEVQGWQGQACGCRDGSGGWGWWGLQSLGNERQPGVCMLDQRFLTQGLCLRFKKRVPLASEARRTGLEMPKDLCSPAEMPLNGASMLPL